MIFEVKNERPDSPEIERLDMNDDVTSDTHDQTTAEMIPWFPLNVEQVVHSGPVSEDITQPISGQALIEPTSYQPTTSN